jgi:hypothetical protein
MSSTITVGRRLIPVEQIALVEPYDPAENPRMQSNRPFQARIVLTDRDTVLTEDSVASFVEGHGFRVLAEDGVATNPMARFWVESFEPTDDYTPTKPYRTRLLWRDSEGAARSKLLVTEPATVLAIAVRGTEPGQPSEEAAGGKRGRAASEAGRRRPRRKNPSPIPA